MMNAPHNFKLDTSCISVVPLLSWIFLGDNVYRRHIFPPYLLILSNIIAWFILLADIYCDIFCYTWTTTSENAYYIWFSFPPTSLMDCAWASSVDMYCWIICRTFQILINVFEPWIDIYWYLPCEDHFATCQERCGILVGVQKAEFLQGFYSLI